MFFQAPGGFRKFSSFSTKLVIFEISDWARPIACCALVIGEAGGVIRLVLLILAVGNPVGLARAIKLFSVFLAAAPAPLPLPPSILRWKLRMDWRLLAGVLFLTANCGETSGLGGIRPLTVDKGALAPPPNTFPGGMVLRLCW